MKYQDPKFSSRPATKAHREGWSRIWERRDHGKSVAEKVMGVYFHPKPHDGKEYRGASESLTIVFDEMRDVTDEQIAVVFNGDGVNVQADGTLKRDPRTTWEAKPKKPRRRKP